MAERTVTILGSTGSVGANTLKVIGRYPDRFRVAGLAAGSNAQALNRQIAQFKPSAVYLDDPAQATRLIRRNGSGPRVFTPSEGLDAFASYADADIVVAASSGTTALTPVLSALERGRRVALANKELLVAAGALVMRALRSNPRATLVPVDSEHSAIFQCLGGAPAKGLKRLLLTSSGGPLRQVPTSRFRTIPKRTVVNHPKWKMGKKISVDSATLMNKGLEIIEASWLFGVPVPRIEVLIHPEAIVHSMVEFDDGSVLAQLGVTDMQLPIQYALSYPERLPVPPSLRLDWSRTGKLTFHAPDRRKFPCLDLAAEAARRAGTAPCVLSAADEVAVGAYLADRIRFTDIPEVIGKVLSRHRAIAEPGIEDIRSTHDWAVEEATRLCRTR